jgi:hypothetical protein
VQLRCHKEHDLLKVAKNSLATSQPQFKHVTDVILGIVGSRGSCGLPQGTPLKISRSECREETNHM